MVNLRLDSLIVHLSIKCLLLSVFLCRTSAFADKNKYYNVSKLCVRKRYLPISKQIDGAVVTSESGYNLDCALTFHTDSILQRFMLRFEHLTLGCNDHLYIYDGADTVGKYKSTKADVGTIFTWTNFVTLKYVTDQWNAEGNGFKVVITSIKDKGAECREFQCLNSFCISQHLICDGVDHCGDNSDETSHASCLESSSSASSESNSSLLPSRKKGMYKKRQLHKQRASQAIEEPKKVAKSKCKQHLHPHNFVNFGFKHLISCLMNI